MPARDWIAAGPTRACQGGARITTIGAVKFLPVAPGRLGALPERLQHDRIELLPQTIADEAGAPVQPFRAVDTVGLLLKRGAISASMATAADEFRRSFRIAHFDTLRAADLTRIPGTQPRSFDPPTWARHRITSILAAIGGTQMMPGSCLWHCIGCEQTLAYWSRTIAKVHPHEGRGVLIASLTFLDEITRGGRPAHR
jgi:hypothetical protein